MNVFIYLNRLFMSQLYFNVMLIFVQSGVVIGKTTNNDEKCIWFDECGPDPTPGRNSKMLNCYYDGQPGKQRG